VRLEDTALIAAQYAIGGRLTDAAQALEDLKFLVGVASRLGDLSAAGRSVIDSALETAQTGLPQR
jgi:hypothetical protein